ncbi:MAG: PaaI family thioesterase [Deferrisomatales bacterium]|nr:PaaI family thioesterase [Deferrisomatales bacterium]
MRDRVFSLGADRAAFLARDFVRGFPAHCGFEVERVAEGVFDTRVLVRAEHRQQDGFVHAGVLATLADHSAGYAAYTLVPEDRRILTIEFKINFLKPAVGDEVRCRSRVLSAGRTVLVAESEVFAVSGGAERLTAKATVTLMAVPVPDLQR